MAGADDRREWARQQRLARDAAMPDRGPARWSEQQERIQAGRDERTHEWEYVDRGSAEFRRDHEPQRWAIDEAVASREKHWRESIVSNLSQASLEKQGAPIEAFRRDARKAIADMPLPPVRHRPVNRDVRRESDTAAEAFFARHRRAEELEQARAEQPGPHIRLRMRRSHEADAPAPVALNDRLAARLGSEQERRRLATELYEEWLLRRRLPELFEERAGRYARDASLDVQMDQAARREAGRPPLDEETALLGRLEQLTVEHGLTEPERVIFQRIYERAADRHAEQLREVWSRREQAPIVQDLRRRLPSIVAERRPLHEPGIRAQLTLEQGERTRRGARPLDTEQEVTRRVERAVIAHDLSPRDRETLETLRAARAQRTRERTSREPAAPVVSPSRQQRPQL